MELEREINDLRRMVDCKANKLKAALALIERLEQKLNETATSD